MMVGLAIPNVSIITYNSEKRAFPDLSDSILKRLGNNNMAVTIDSDNGNQIATTLSST